MAQQLLTESPEKTKQEIARREVTAEAARSVHDGSPSPILQLHRALGNQRVAQLIQAKRLTPQGKILDIQAKLTVGAADDQYEQEADRVARHVVSMPDSVALAALQQAPPTKENAGHPQSLQSKPLPLAASITPFVQRIPHKAHDREEDKEQDKSNEVVQAKRVNDPMFVPLQRQEASEKEGEEPVQAKRVAGTSSEALQRQPAGQEEERDAIQAKSTASLAESFDAGEEVESRLGQSKGSGSPLPDPVRAYMEPRFGVDFSHVRVHTGSHAVQMNRAVAAQAFTHGSDIYYGAGHSPTNLDLTAHELTHVVQQTEAPRLETKRLDETFPVNADSSIQRTYPACTVGNPYPKCAEEKKLQAKTQAGLFPQVAPELELQILPQQDGEFPSHGEDQTEIVSPEVISSSTVPVSAVRPPISAVSPSPATPSGSIARLGGGESANAPSAPSPASSTPISTVPSGVTGTAAAAPPSTTPAPAIPQSQSPAPHPTSGTGSPQPAPSELSSAPNAVNSSGTTVNGGPPNGHTAPQVTTAGNPPPANQTSPAKTSPEGQTSTPVASSQPAMDAGATSPEYQVFLQQLQGIRGGLAKTTIDRKQRITEGANAQKQGIQQLVETEAVRLEGIYDNTLKNVTSALTMARTEIEAGKAAKIKSTRTTAQTELDRLNTVQREKNKAMQSVAEKKAVTATAMGEREAQRAIEGSRTRAGRAQQVKQEKVNQLRNVKDSEQLVADVERRVADLVLEFTRAGNDLAAMARKRAGEAAEHIKTEAPELVSKMDQPANDAHTEITNCRDATINSIQDQAQTSLTNLQKEANDISTNLNGEREAKCAQVRANAKAISQAVDKSVTQAHQKVDSEASRTSEEITRFVNKISEVSWAGSQLGSTGSDLTKAVTNHNTEQDGFATNVITGVGTGITNAVNNLGKVVTDQGKAVTTIGTDFETKVSKASAKVIETMEEARKEGAVKIAEPAKQMEEKLQRGVERVGEEWDRQLKVVENDISHDVNDGLRKQDDAVAALSSSLDSIGSQTRSWFSSIGEAIVDFGSFIAGVVVGMLKHAWDILKDLWELIKKPLFWIVVAIVVVIIIIAIIWFSWAAVAGALATIGKVLLVVGIIIGVGIAIYYIYQAITKPDLSPYERGKLVGEAIDEIILAFIGTGIWSKLGAWVARVSRIAAFLDKVGDVLKAARLLRRVHDVEVAVRLMDEIKDAGIVLRLLEEIDDVETVLKLWRAVGSAEDILKLWAEIKNAENIIKLWPELKNADTILKLWAEIKNADVILKLWATVKDADAILKLWAKIKDADLIVKLWGKLADADKLIQFLDKVKDGKMLLQLLEKVADVGQLERLLSKVDNAAELEKLLQHMSPQEIEDFITALGDLNLFKQLATKYGGDALKFYGAKFFKDFKGVDAATMNHLLAVGIDSKKGIIGCHDQAMFLHELLGVPPPVTSPPPGLGRGNIIGPPTPHPADPNVTKYSYQFWAQDGKGGLVSPPTLKAGAHEKTVIKGLATDSPKWQAVAMEAAEDAVRKMTFPQGDGKFTGAAASGLSWEGWYRGGKIDTIFVIF